mgnify:FL=1
MARGLDRGGNKEKTPDAFNPQILTDLRALNFSEDLIRVAIDIAGAESHIPKTPYCEQIASAILDAFTLSAPGAAVTLDRFNPLVGRDSGSLAHRLLNTYSVTLNHLISRVPNIVRAARAAIDGHTKKELYERVQDDALRQQVESELTAVFRAPDPMAEFTTRAGTTGNALAELYNRERANFDEIQTELTGYFNTSRGASPRDTQVKEALAARVAENAPEPDTTAYEPSTPIMPRVLRPLAVPGARANAISNIPAARPLPDVVRSELAVAANNLDRTVGGYGRGVGAAALAHYLRDMTPDDVSDRLIDEAVNILRVPNAARGAHFRRGEMDALDQVGRFLPPPQVLEEVARKAAHTVDARFSETAVKDSEFIDAWNYLPGTLLGTAARREPLENMTPVLRDAVLYVLDSNSVDNPVVIFTALQDYLQTSAMQRILF